MKQKDIKSILLFKLRYIGDVLLTTPAIRLLRQAYPDAHMTMVVNKGTEEVLRYNPHLDEILTIDRNIVDRGGIFQRLSHEWNTIKKLRERSYDLSIDFDSGERAAILGYLCKPDIRVGFRYRKGIRRLIFNRQVTVEGNPHTVERNLLLVEKTLGLKCRDNSLELSAGKEEEQRMSLWLRKNGLRNRNFFVIHPGARFWYKRWPANKWSHFLDIIQGELGIPVILTGAERENDEARLIIARMKTDPFSLIGKTTLLELAALLKKATLFIGNDSGPMHVAAAQGVPVIALFGPTSPAVWRPWGYGHAVISRYISCSPCKQPRCEPGEDNCMENISIEDLLRAVCQFMEIPIPVWQTA